ncbi:MAG: ribonuclease H-like domain-containing protein [Mogibacterium sp.]|nr:ribonuclease H-like domain-containing protein [Mogibacterium sp.]
MKVFTRDYRITGEYHPEWDAYFSGMKPCVLDIEATGLDRSRCKAILTGLLMRTESGVRITQFLAENHYEESRVLEATMDYLEENDAGYLITFNGCAFDVPFLNARLDANFLGRQLKMYHFDLYRFLRKCTDLKGRLESMSQMSIENYYGILSDRGDTITGKESVALFDQYAISGNSTIEKIILTHNREDVLHLNRLMYLTLADVPDIHQAMASYGFPASEGRLSVRPKVKNFARILRITGEQITDPVAAAYFPDADVPVTATFNATSSSFEITAPLNSHGEELYMDVSFIDSPLLRADPDYVNGYLILNSRTVNIVSKVLSELYLLK